MKSQLKFVFFTILIGSLHYLSCKKDLVPLGEINKPPIANAGPDKTIQLPLDSVILDGSASRDPDGSIKNWMWTKISGPLSSIIIKPTDSISKVKALVTGSYQFELKVTDNGGLFSKDIVLITVNSSSAPPNTTFLTCNTSMSLFNHLPTTGGVRYTVTAGTKILFIRSPGEVDIYDTVTHNWETVNGMYATGYYSSEQYAHKTAKVGSKIIFSGMVNPLDTVQGQIVNIYDAATNSWSTTHLLQARSFYAMAVVGNKVFYAGGNNGSKKMDVYDAANDSWSVANFDNARRTGMAAVSFGNKIYFAGGFIARYDSLVLECDDDGNNCHNVPAIVSTDRVDILDVSTNTWSVAHLSEGRGGIISTAIIGNKIVFAGGEKWGAGYSSKVDFYDVVSNAWSSTNVGSPFVYDAYTVGNKLLITTATEIIHIYDATSNSWSTAQMPSTYGADNHEHGLVTSVGSKLLFFLQYIGHDDSSRGIDIYDASSNTWCHAQLNFDLLRTGMVKVGNRVYIAGGLTMVGCCIYNNPIDTVWQLNL